MEGNQVAIEVTVPGKVILFGEHSVVYGKRSIVVSLDLFTTIKFIPTQDKLEINMPDISFHHTWSQHKIDQLMKKLGLKNALSPRTILPGEISAIKEILSLDERSHFPGLVGLFYLYCSIFDTPICIKIDICSKLPIGGGLGSSAAYGSGLAAGFLCISGHIDSSLNNPDHLMLVSNWGFSCEQILHGKPSGVDNTMCTYGGAITFKKGVMEKLALPSFEILLINTKVSRETKSLVSHVKKLKEKYPTVVEPILDAMDCLSEKVLLLLQEQINSVSCDYEIESCLSELIGMNQCLLTALGVSHPTIDRFVSIAKSYGLAAKLTGAGGGGCGFILVGKNGKNSVSECIKELKDSGFCVESTSLGGVGLSIKRAEQ